MVHDYQDLNYPLNVIQVVLSHIIPTFATIVNMIIGTKISAVHQPKLTQTADKCYSQLRIGNDQAFFTAFLSEDFFRKGMLSQSWMAFFTAFLSEDFFFAIKANTVVKNTSAATVTGKRKAPIF